MRVSLLVALFAGIAALGIPAAATRADPAQDLLATCEPPQSSFEFGGTGGTPIPADFFSPGSQPFEGTVYFQGAPLDASSTADTILRRPGGDPFAPGDPPGGPLTVPIEIVALSLHSVAPVTIAPDASTWNVELTLSPAPPPLGQLHVTKTHANGGTFDSTLPVQPLFVFTRVEAPFTRLEWDPEVMVPVDLSGAPWVSDVDPNLHLADPATTDFHPGIEEPAPGDPTSQMIVPFNSVGPGPMKLTLCPALATAGVPALPPPGLAALAACLLAAALLAARRLVSAPG